MLNHVSKNISSVLLDISRQQLLFQARQNQLYDLMSSLSGSSNLNTIATLPKLEADIDALSALHGRINHSVQAVNRNVPTASNYRRLQVIAVPQ